MLFNPQSSLKYNANNYLSERLKQDGSGTVNMAISAGTSGIEFSYTIPAENKALLYRTLIVLEDGSVEIEPGNFGALSALTRGIDFCIVNSGGTTVLENFKTNREIRDTMYDFDQQFKTAGAYVGRWTHEKDLGVPISLGAGESIKAVVKEDISGLDYLCFHIKGLIYGV